MKRTVSLLLVLALLFSCGMITAFAQDSKLTEELELVIAHSAPNDRIPISINIDGYEKFVQDMPSYPDKTQKGDNADFQKAYDEFSAYLAKLEGEVLPEILEGVTEPKLLSVGVGSYVRLEVEAQDVAKIAAHDNVKAVKYRAYKFYPNVPEGISDELQDVLDNSEPDDVISVYLFFGGRVITVADMPSWPDRTAANAEYSRFCEARNRFLESRVLQGAEVEMLYQGVGDFFILKAKAKDILRFNESGHVINIDYYSDIIDDPGKEDEPIDIDDKAYAKIDQAVIDMLAADVEEQYVYIDLDLETKVIKEMPSWPDHRKAEIEYDRYLWQEQQPAFETILAQLNSAAELNRVRPICYEALTARVTNSAEAIAALAVNEHVRAIKSFDCGNWATDHSKYDDSNTRNRYRDRLISQFDYLDPSAPCLMYQELFCHDYTPDDKEYGCDWALAEASYATIVATAENWKVVGGRLLYAGGLFQKPFEFNIGIYDAEQDRFFDITEIDFDDYPGLYEVWQQLDIGELTDYEQPGDADGDRDVTILDATVIQRGIADLKSRNDIVATGADTDGDGEMTVLDATRIQRYKAELCTLTGEAYEESPD